MWSWSSGARPCPRPASRTTYTPLEYLTKLSEEGLIRKYNGNPPQHVIERMNYELGIIEKTGFAQYILIVRDFAQVRRREGHLLRRARLGGGLPRLLPRGHYRHRPGRVRPDLRAVPEPRARPDARRGYGLRGHAPRRSDRVRHQKVQPRSGRSRRRRASRRSSRSERSPPAPCSKTRDARWACRSATWTSSAR